MLRPVMGFLIFEKFQTLCNALTNCIYESDCDKSELALSKYNYYATLNWVKVESIKHSIFNFLLKKKAFGL